MPLNEVVIDPAHLPRVARWQLQYSLDRHPVVVVDSIPGIVGRLTTPTRRTLADGTRLYIERRSVRIGPQ